MLDLLSLSYNKINYKYNKLTKGQQKKGEKRIEHDRTWEQPTSVVHLALLTVCATCVGHLFLLIVLSRVLIGL